jgi:hypothetical protein
MVKTHLNNPIAGFRAKGGGESFSDRLALRKVIPRNQKDINRPARGGSEPISDRLPGFRGDRQARQQTGQYVTNCLFETVSRRKDVESRCHA